jgi:putative transposase
MPRRPRVFVDGATYHVCCRVGRGEPVFRDDVESEAFVEVLQGVKRRDGVTVLAWCLMSNHYHLAMRTSRVPLWRTMRLVQGRFAKDYNRRHEVYGSLWQGRYKAMLVRDQGHLRQVIAYIHLNPVVACMVKEPGRHRWSGHNEVVNGVSTGLMDVDEALLAFGETREAARGAYLRVLERVGKSTWAGAELSRLPWWKVEVGEDEPLATTRGPRLDALGASTEPDRRMLPPEEFLVTAADVLDVEVGQLTAPRSGRELTRIREMLALVGVETYRIKGKDLARLLGRNPGAVSRWLWMGGRRRVRDPDFRDRVDRFSADIRAATTPRLRGESEFITGAGPSFVD